MLASVKSILQTDNLHNQSVSRWDLNSSTIVSDIEVCGKAHTKPLKVTPISSRFSPSFSCPLLALYYFVEFCVFAKSARSSLLHGGKTRR